MLQQALVSRRPVKSIEGGAEALRAFAEHEKHHLVMENAVLAPFARKRLAPDDLGRLAERFAAAARRRRHELRGGAVHRWFTGME